MIPERAGCAECGPIIPHVRFDERRLKTEWVIGSADLPPRQTSTLPFSKDWSSMTIADFYSNLGHRDVVILLMVNDCNGADLLAYKLLG